MTKASVTEADTLPPPLATRIGALASLVDAARPDNCAALRDVEAIVDDTLLLIENSLSVEAAAQSVLLDCAMFADELMRVGIYWSDGDIDGTRAGARIAIDGFAAALQAAAPSPAALGRDLSW
jgi:hypothetical protein